MKKTKQLSLLVSCTFLLFTFPVNAATNPTPKPRVTFAAVDSVKMNKDKSLLYLYGAVQFDCKTFHVTADEIVFNKITKKISAKNYKFLNKKDHKETRGIAGEFDVD